MTTALKDLTLKAARHWVVNLILRIVSEVRTMLYTSHKLMYKVNEDGFDKAGEKAVFSDAETRVRFKLI